MKKSRFTEEQTALARSRAGVCRLRAPAWSRAPNRQGLHSAEARISLFARVRR